MRLRAILVCVLLSGLPVTGGWAQGTTHKCYGATCVTTTTDVKGNIDVRATGPDGSTYSTTTRSTQSPNGDLSVRSQDSQGNSYSLDTRTRTLPGGGHEVTSQDSQGNSYSIRSWCDSAGCHSTDTMGNRCTITPSGTMIGCGQ
ncbi:hypothetical protein [Niveispirillum sp. KHB5.9]|uniref:hypothetical protein n=1 Tax=Niveispirillum sp. KHB5.9 TaxID=3400269 RepID=UPI003A8747ED